MKPKVAYHILDDMKKYIKGFDENKYEKTWNPYDTDLKVISYVRDYYKNHMPVNATAWMRVNEPNPNLIYGKYIGEQLAFVRDTLNNLLNEVKEEWSVEDYEANEPLIISTYVSKSVTLPVYLINAKKYGVEIVLRYNFYDWKMSVKSDKPLEFDFMGLFDTKEVIEAYACEGFPEDKVYGSYEQNHSKFTFEIVSKYDLYTFIFLLKNYLKN